MFSLDRLLIQAVFLCLILLFIISLNKLSYNTLTKTTTYSNYICVI